ncbi:MIP/aquaporin family protein [Algisphaera agarilytica]|uniref:Glycerol uptake facilitator protein n=1 Tax=Algisphaera agarilytica TaxID=1385975 RepID=A0A7X0H825_9BACT|nr:MIP/aquaporin family protein [Algisphaera agarilytica]MBB6431007.1 glycerol uptake facilitator protein [Algisphaera agarilytica]
MNDQKPYGRWIAEAVGTFLLVLFGTGVVHVAVFSGALQGLGQVAVAWGIGIGLAIYATAAVSGAHLNPAVTLALAIWRGFSWKQVGPYVAAQFVGAFAAAATLHGLFHNWIAHFETANNITRGEPGSQRSAMAYGEYFPNPDFGTDAEAFELVSHVQAFGAEALGTGLLVFFIFALIDPRNRNAPLGRAVAFPIGLVVTVLICLLAVLTQGGFNPARDFGPRVFAFLAGWGEIAIPGPRGGFFTVYILAPLVGAVIGGAAFDFLIRPHLPKAEQD